jgi:molybdopterin synthase catalytic subunit
MIKLQTESLDVGTLLNQFCQGQADIGGVVSFTGIARHEDGQVTSLELEAYPGFTETWIEDLVLVANQRFSLLGSLVVHRTGLIAPGEAIVFVASAARHRRQAFEGADFLMDHLKSRAPFWKKQHGPGGEHWIEPRSIDYQDLDRWKTSPSDATD